MKVFKLSNKSTIDVLLCVLSLLLAVFSPRYYSFNYCLLIHNLFLLTFVYNTIKNRKDGFLSFNLIYSVSLYCTSFIYPVFIYNTADRYFSMFSYSFDENLISYSTAVAYMSYCFLQLGLNNKQQIKKPLNINNAGSAFYDVKTPLIRLSFLFLVLLTYFVLNGGLSYFSDQFIYSLSDNDIIMGYLVQFITPISYALLILSFYLKKKSGFCFYFAIGLVLLYALLILSTGSRTIPISIIIMTLFLFNERIKKIRVVNLAILGIGFVIIMLLAGSLRGNGELISTSSISENAADVLSEKEDNYLFYASELIICNRNLYFLIGSTDNVGYTYGATVLGSFLGVIPFLSQAFLRITGLPEAAINSAKYNTVLSGSLERGLGTHAVGDIYLCWGIIGVIIVFYLYGYIITALKNKNSILYSAAYYVILSNSIYACRATIFNLNFILWTVLVLYVFLYFGKKKQLSIH